MINTAEGKGGPLTPAEADANQVEFDRRTRQGWRDNIVELTVDSSSPDAPTLNPFRGGTKAWTFGPGELTEAHSAWHIDHDYKPGTKLYMHMHWAPATAAAGAVRWGFEYTVAKGHQQQAFPATTTVYVTQPTTGEAFMHMVAEVSDTDAIDGLSLGVEPDTVIKVRVFRDGANAADTFSGAVFGLFLDLHYQADKATTPNKSPDFYGA